jgi:hypothetical protein
LEYSLTISPLLWEPAMEYLYCSGRKSDRRIRAHSPDAIWGGHRAQITCYNTIRAIFFVRAPGG